MSDEQNLRFMNNPERVKAEKELREALKHIEGIKTLSAQTVLVCMPPALNRLNKAYDNLIVIETRLEQEIMQEN